MSNQTLKNKIINGDSLKELKKIPDETFDLIFADPPYNLQLKKELIRPDTGHTLYVLDEPTTGLHNYDVKNLLEKEISNFISTEIEWVPINKINLNEEDKEKMNKFLDVLEEDDDVQNIFTNSI